MCQTLAVCASSLDKKGILEHPGIRTYKGVCPYQGNSYQVYKIPLNYIFSGKYGQLVWEIQLNTHL